WLEVTDVRVERLQDISEEDARAEGVISTRTSVNAFTSFENFYDYIQKRFTITAKTTAKESFCTLWQSINSIGSWYLNPWVWVVSFKVLSTTGRPESLAAKELQS